MNNQKRLHQYTKNIQLAMFVNTMSNNERLLAADVIRECDIARLMKKSTIQRELKEVRGKHKGKVKLFLTALSKNPDAEYGANALFERWSSKANAMDSVTHLTP
jgi:hypothetical protein